MLCVQLECCALNFQERVIVLHCNSAALKHNVFPMHFLKKWTWACDRLKTGNLSADNFKKYSTLVGQTWARDTIRWYWSGYPVLTAVNCSQHGCAISGCTRIESVRLNIGCLAVRTDARSVGRCTVTWLPIPLNNIWRHVIGHLHDGVILLLRPESFSFLLSYLNLVIPVRFE